MQICKQGAVAHVVHLPGLLYNSVAQIPIPSEILRLLEQFKPAFDDPKTLPPRRDCDHRIPLMPRAQPVKLRPYRYKPDLKSEIQRHIKELLVAGIIQRSASPFSSPALLVKKKDGT